MLREPRPDRIQQVFRIPTVVIWHRDDFTHREFQPAVASVGRASRRANVTNGKIWMPRDNRYQSIVRVLIHDDRFELVICLSIKTVQEAAQLCRSAERSDDQRKHRIRFLALSAKPQPCLPTPSSTGSKPKYLFFTTTDAVPIGAELDDLI